LLARLLQGLLGDDSTAADEDGLTGLTLDHDRLGRPTLVQRRTGAEANVGISFSHGLPRSWAAAARGYRVGIDAAEEVDFTEAYPYRRVFTDLELERVLSLHGGRLPSAAAYLWATKEAAVKALGHGFHSLDYREVEVIARIPGGALLSAVSVRGLLVTAWARRERSTWLAVAVAGPVVPQSI
jgi:phosphopantetheinyl transferase